MAGKIVNDITLLFKTKLDEQSKQEVGRNLRALLENAAIGFDEAEIRRNLVPIVRMIQTMFDKAEIAFDADKLLAMPGRQALQALANMEVSQLQAAFDRAVAKSGGVKIDFGNTDLSAMTEPMERLAQELASVGERVASTTKKSVYEIEKAVRSIGKDKALKKIASPEQIEAALSEASSDKKIHPSQAVARLEKARELYTTSVEEDNPWVVQYRYLLDFISKYERLTHQAKMKVESERPEFAQLYEMLSPKAGAAKISLQHYVDIAKGNELSEYKNQPWARESTLQKIESTLRGGISVKGSVGDGDGGETKSAAEPQDTAPATEQDGGSKTKKAKTMVAAAEPTTSDLSGKEDAAAADLERRAAEQRKVNAEKSAAASTVVAEEVAAVAQTVQSATSEIETRIKAAMSTAMANTSGRPWSSISYDDKERYVDASLRENFPLYSELDEDAQFESIGDLNALLNGELSMKDAIRSLGRLTMSLEELYASANAEVQKLVRQYAAVAGTKDGLDVADQLADEDALISNLIGEDINGEWTRLQNRLLGKETPEDAAAQQAAERERIANEASAKAEERARVAAQAKAQADAESAAAAEREAAAKKTTAEQQETSLANLSHYGGMFKEKFAYLNVERGIISPHIEGGYEGVGKGARQDLLDSVGGEWDSTLHTHPDIVAAPSETDIQSFVNYYDTFRRSFILAGKQLAEIDFTQLTQQQAQQLADTYKQNVIDTEAARVDRFSNTPLKDIGVESLDIDSALTRVSEQLMSKFPDLITDINAYIARLRAMFQQVSATDLSYEQLLGGLDKAASIGFKNAGADIATDIYQITQDVFDSETGVPTMYQQELQDLFVKTIGDLGFDPSQIFKLHNVEDFQAQLDATRQQAQARRENAAAAQEETAAQAQLNAAESQNPPAQDESGVHNANAEAIDNEAEAQKRLNSLEISGLYYAAKFPENHPGELEGALQNNPNIISDLAAQRDALLQKMQPVKDMASRISKMSSIKDIPFEDLYQEAANVGRQLSTMYDDGIRDTEEYVALQYKLIHIFEKLSTAYGGVKGSGAKDRSELYQWLGDSIHQRTGYNPMQDGFAVDAIWGQGSHSIAKTANKMFSVKEMAANMLDYGGIGSIAFAGDESDLSELNVVIDALAQIQQSSSAAKTSVDGLNDSLERKNATEQSDAGGAEAEETNAETAAIQQQNAALQENISLQGQADGQADAAGQTGTGATATVPAVANEADKMAISAEAAELEAIRSKLLAITDAVNAKTNAFTQEEAEVKRVAASEIQALSEVENKINAAKTALANIRTNVDSVHTPEVNAEAFTQESQAAEGAVAKEIGSIQKLRAALQLTTKRINEKTQAFETESAIVTKVVNSEINALRSLGTQVGVINAGILDLLSNLRSAKADAANIVVPKVQTSASGDGGEATKPGKKPGSATKKNDADESARLARLNKIKTLEKEVGQFRADADATTNEGVRNALQEEIALRERMIELLTRGKELSAEEEARAIRAAELRTKEAKEVAARESKEAAKAERRTASEARSFAQSDAMLGKAKSAVGRAETTWMNAVGIDGLPDSFVAQIDEYYQKLEALRRKHQELKSGEMISPEQKQALINQTIEIDKMTGEISELIAEYQKLSGTNVDETKTRATTLTGGSSLGEYESQMRRYVQEITNGQGKIKSFDAATRTMTYTVKTGANEFTEYTASVRRLDGALVSVQKTTKRAETFFEATARKMREISSYFTGMMLISRVTMELRRGVQYVREIDAALTELKKVTDATEESYEKFLDTAAKTADKVGSTIQKVVSSAADWARLGSVLAKTSISPFI